MLYLISLGLHDEKDISLKALEAVKSCERLYLELYTNKMFTSSKKLSEIVGKEVIEIKRSSLEENIDKIIKEAQLKNISVFVGGDALSATTHSGILLDCKKMGVECKVIHGSSIFTAVAETGLQLYKFGKTTTLVYPEEKYEPKSSYEVIKQNKTIGAHTLVLLDIKHDKNKYMTVKEGLELLLKGKVVSEDDNVIACYELGGDSIIKYDTASNLIKQNITKTPAVIVIPGELHFIEKEFLENL